MQRNFKRFCALFFVIALLLAGVSAYAKVPSPGKDFYYLDEAGIMSTETKSMLYTNGEALKKACGAQIVVVVVNSFGGMTAADYAYAIINEWGVGDKKENNGVVLVIDEKGGEYRMTIGTGLERYMTSSAVQNLLDKYFHPLFADYKTDLAIRNLYAQVFKTITKAYNLNLNLVSGSDLPGEIMVYEEEKSGISDVVLTILIVLVIIWLANRSRGGGFVHRPRTSSSGSFMRGFIAGSMSSAHRHRPHGGFHSGGFSSGSSSRSSGSFRSGGFGGARGGGGGGRGIGGGGRR